MNLQKRIDLMSFLGDYLKQNPEDWQLAKQKASIKNAWFTENFIEKATQNIIEHFLDKNKLTHWAAHYHLDDLIKPDHVGIVMAGNIPMVGFHDLLTVFISGHKQSIKLSSKDDVLISFLVEKLYEQNPESKEYIKIADNLKGCDAYIATGSNQSAQHFVEYFGKYPNIIRCNRTSVAILNGNESKEELEALSDDIHLYYGLGCRNVTKLFVPEHYDFVPLLQSFHKFSYFRDYHKYSNNYDFQLSLLLLNNNMYMTNETTLLVENKNNFSAIGVVHYEHYNEQTNLKELLNNNSEIQCIVGENFIPFGQSQQPGLFTYADGVDTMQFLLGL